MDRFVFRSIENTEHAYVWNDHGEYMRHGDPIDHRAGWFMVYNDYPVQHSLESHVQRHNLVDYIESLALALKEGPQVAREFVAQSWHRGCDKRDFEFVCGIKYRDDKTQYFCRNDRKVSASSTKRHDKRWDEVPSYANGSFSACMRLLYEGHESLLETANRAYLLMEYFNERDRWASGNCIAEYLNLPDLKDYPVRFRMSLGAIQGYVKAVREVEYANRMVENCARRREQEAQLAT